MGKLEIIKKKIVAPADLKFDKAYWKFKNFKVVFTNGCFDIIHRGHIEYLAQASNFGDIFIIGLNSDESVKKNKGKERPIIDQESRAILLASFQFVDYVIFFDEETPYELIKYINPDVLVKGADYIDKDIVGYDIVKKNKGEVKTVNLTKGYSTSTIINKIKKL